MLGDVVAQFRHGVFPVWIGQSEYAFNGTVSPLRVAPWFQYMGGLLDLLTGRRLEPTALKNAELCVHGLAAAASAYLALRVALRHRPGVACVLTLLWLTCPALLAMVYSSDQYLQWVALPFLPILALGCWRLWVQDDWRARLLITVGAAGMMLAHTPTAFWGGLLAAGMCAGRLVTQGGWRREVPRLAAMTVLFLALGGFPIGSALLIDNAAGMSTPGSAVADGAKASFPDNFKPMDLAHGPLAGYQMGYGLLATALLALALLAWLRPRGTTAFVAALAAIAVLTVPVPKATSWVWSHAPAVVATINGVSPALRLFEFAGLLIAFALALAVADPRLDRRSGPMRLLLLFLAGAGLWSAAEAAKMARSFRTTFSPAADANVNLRPENLRLTRYVYSPFRIIPGYASHGYVDPLLENRLLDRRDLRLLASNAEAAAPPLDPDTDPARVPRLAQAGTWMATSDNGTRIYNLTDPLRLAAGQRYALRVDFLTPPRSGVLQIISADLFREYLLPDSGAGFSDVPLAFGSLPSSSHVAALEQNSSGTVVPALRFVAPQYAGERFAFAHFWLFTYDRSNLPVRVSSWIPYRAEAETAIPAWLETPRVWQRGWQARVNGRRVEVRSSPHALAMIPLEPGTSHVELTFQVPLWLSAWFWLCAAGWSVLLLALARGVVRRAATDSPLPTPATRLSPPAGWFP